MTPSIQTVSPLRQRMLDDMRMRKLEPRTQRLISVPFASWLSTCIDRRIPPLPQVPECGGQTLARGPAG